ncbi:MAG TPA: hypothetical protein VFG50_16740 [Rhodothermales bacterium]|nr:hypothetical protein [Rhodothermales bacterium]
MASKYEPIDCNFYDELTLRATYRRVSEVRYRDEAGVERVVRAVIEDVFTRGPEEFLKLEGGLEIRLDRILSVDGILLPGAC